MNSSDLDAGQVAWDDRETRAIFRRSLRSVWVLLGLVVLAISIYTINSAINTHAVSQFEQNGISTTGVVVGMEKFVCQGKGASMGVWVVIRFDVDGREQEYPFLASCGGELFVRAAVPVVYDPHNPSSFTVNHATTLNRRATGLLLLSFVIAFPSAIIGFVLFLEKMRIRSVLKQTRWVRTTCNVTRVPKGAGGKFAVEIWTSDGPTSYLATDTFSRVLRKAESQELLIAGHDNSARIIRQPEGKRLLMVKRSAKPADAKKDPT